MKSRATTCLLLAVVVAVWGIVAWKIFAPVTETAPAARPKAAAPSSEPLVADTLRLDYSDPFLKGVPRQRTPTAATPVRRLPAAKPSPPRRERVKIVHLGTVASGGKRLFILSVGDRQYEIACGGAAGDFVLAGFDRDSLYLRKDGITYGVKQCEQE